MKKQDGNKEKVDVDKKVQNVMNSLGSLDFLDREFAINTIMEHYGKTNPRYKKVSSDVKMQGSNPEEPKKNYADILAKMKVDREIQNCINYGLTKIMPMVRFFEEYIDVELVQDKGPIVKDYKRFLKFIGRDDFESGIIEKVDNAQLDLPINPPKNKKVLDEDVYPRLDAMLSFISSLHMIMKNVEFIHMYTLYHMVSRVSIIWCIVRYCVTGNLDFTEKDPGCVPALDYMMCEKLQSTIVPMNDCIYSFVEMGYPFYKNFGVHIPKEFFENRDKMMEEIEKMTKKKMEDIKKRKEKRERRLNGGKFNKKSKKNKNKHK